MNIAVLLLFTATVSALADSRFQVRHLTRGDVPPGKGQCDIRLRVDNEVEVSLRGDVLTIHTVAGQNARDDGSECSEPLPLRDIDGFDFQSKESRNEMALVSQPSARNGFAAVIRIRDSSGGFGRYHFRLTWIAAGTASVRRSDDVERPRGAGGFSWNNAIAFHGKGKGDAWLNDFGPVRLSEVKIDIDQGGKLLCWFRSDRGRGITFTGDVIEREQNRWKADVMSEDRRYRGSLYFTVDRSGNVASVSIEAGDGRDRMQINWDRQ